MAGQAATKEDLDTLGGALRGEMHGMRDELRGEMHGIRDELRGEIRAEGQAVRDELRGEIRAVGVGVERIESFMRGLAEANTASSASRAADYTPRVVGQSV